MSQGFRILILFYGVIMLITAFLGYVLSLETTGETKRLGSRLVLTCWAWPVWLVIGIVLGVKVLWRESGWGGK